ncbi:cell surface protein [Lactiplantibacillus fabifermentans T30PCM01]|uniref:Cell surface protein n=1 Tax=Lactiplantibacillus fabifermentans T30PCM01 TaxID=1400520 RepID=W6T8M8_9LACO|nr:L,D-transpeptidase [Lactiplantibacillus fabifermentans]ETY74724.1 cell surface protein [Lactiplantibacillus fabifermentans T30PCM01]
MNSRIIMGTTTVLATSVIVVGFTKYWQSKHAEKRINHVTLAKSAKPKKIATVKPKVQSIDWRAPSMPNRSYPDVNKHPNLSIEVSTKAQRVYLRENDQTLYTMRASTGRAGDATPTGQFEIQPERGLHFYNQQSGEGANYWVSFKDHGIYLFHSVPVDAQGHYVVNEANELGKQANSHGCVRLSIADAKWLYENIRQHTPVTVS